MGNLRSDADTTRKVSACNRKEDQDKEDQNEFPEATKTPGEKIQSSLQAEGARDMLCPNSSSTR